MACLCGSYLLIKLDPSNVQSLRSHGTICSQNSPLLVTDFYQAFETSDSPARITNIVTGARNALVPTLAAHDDVAALWYFGSSAGSK